MLPHLASWKAFGGTPKEAPLESSSGLPLLKKLFIGNTREEITTEYIYESTS
jgi:hypothetical protein